MDNARNLSLISKFVKYLGDNEFTLRIVFGVSRAIIITQTSVVCELEISDAIVRHNYRARFADMRGCLETLTIKPELHQHYHPLTLYGSDQNYAIRLEDYSDCLGDCEEYYPLHVSGYISIELKYQRTTTSNDEQKSYVTHTIDYRPKFEDLLLIMITHVKSLYRDDRDYRPKSARML